MLCCFCKEKDAKIHLTQIAGDKMQKVDLCEDCARKKGIDDTASASLADLLAALGADIAPETAAVPGGITRIDVARLVRRSE